MHVQAEKSLLGIFDANEARILKLGRSTSLILEENSTAPKASARAVLAGGAELAIPLEGLIDFAKEAERLGGQIEKLLGELSKLQGQLSNQNFVDRAPSEKVQEIRDRVAEIEIQTVAMRRNLDALSN